MASNKSGEQVAIRNPAVTKVLMNQPLFKDRLRALRGKLGQKEMAAMLDVSVSRYRSWEYGKRTPEKLALAEIERRISKTFPTPDTARTCDRDESGHGDSTHNGSARSSRNLRTPHPQ